MLFRSSAINAALQNQAADPDSLKSLYNRIYADVPLLPPLDQADNILSAKIIPFNKGDLTALDAALRKGGVSHG